MFLKLTIIACSLASSIAVTYGPIQGQVSPKYPAGIDPNTCPNFPYCSNPLVTVSQGLKVNTEKEKEGTPEFEYSPYQITPEKTPQYEVYPARQAPSKYAPPRYHIKLLRPAAPKYQHPVVPFRLTVPFNPFQSTPQFKFTPPHQIAPKLQLAPSREAAPQYGYKQYQAAQPQYYPQVSAAYKPKYTETPKPQRHQYRVSEEQPYKSGYENGQKQGAMEKEVELLPYASGFENEYSAEQQRALDRGEYIGDGDYHGEGLSEGYGDEDEE